MCCGLSSNFIDWSFEEEGNTNCTQPSSLNVSRRKRRLFAVFVIIILSGSISFAAGDFSTGALQRIRSFNYGWKFTTEDVFYAYYNNTDDSQRQEVALSHTPRYELVVVSD